MLLKPNYFVIKICNNNKIDPFIFQTLLLIKVASNDNILL